MSRRLGFLLCSWILLVPVIGLAEEPAGKLKAGDRIVFLGDSITQGGAGPNGYVTMIRQALDKKHADLKIEVIGAGISGNKVPDLQHESTKTSLPRNRPSSSFTSASTTSGMAKKIRHVAQCRTLLSLA